METKEDFIQAMRAMPDDVVLMCAFSDWLEEHDDPMWEGMQLLAEYGLIGGTNGYYEQKHEDYQSVGYYWFRLRWVPDDNAVNERISLSMAFSRCDDENKAAIRQELSELYPNSDAMRAAVDRSTPA